MRFIETETEKQKAFRLMGLMTRKTLEVLNKRNELANERYEVGGPEERREMIQIGPHFSQPGEIIGVASYVIDNFNPSGRFEYINLFYDYRTNTMSIRGTRGIGMAVLTTLWGYAVSFSAGFVETVSMSMDLD